MRPCTGRAGIQAEDRPTAGRRFGGGSAALAAEHVVRNPSRVRGHRAGTHARPDHRDLLTNPYRPVELIGTDYEPGLTRCRQARLLPCRHGPHRLLLPVQSAAGVHAWGGPAFPAADRGDAHHDLGPVSWQASRRVGVHHRRAGGILHRDAVLFRGASVPRAAGVAFPAAARRDSGEHRQRAVADGVRHRRRLLHAPLPDPHGRGASAARQRGGRHRPGRLHRGVSGLRTVAPRRFPASGDMAWPDA